jgi:predicted enzyme related to lactoylglutathione lyase
VTAWLHAVLDLPASAVSAEAFWAGTLGWPLAEPWPGHPELRSFAPPSGDAYVHRQSVQGRPGVHFDVEVADVPSETERLVALGARRVRTTAEWQTLRSPGGLAFCLVPGRRHAARPDPVTGPDGVRRRLVQVCLDIPARHLDAEPDFWRAVLPWREVVITEPEFLGRLVPPPGSTLQVLLQRLGDDDGGTTTRAHLDLGSDDITADAERLVQRGATRLHTGGGFIALRDPAGLAFCVTANSPDAP